MLTSEPKKIKNSSSAPSNGGSSTKVLSESSLMQQKNVKQKRCSMRKRKSSHGIILKN